MSNKDWGRHPRGDVAIDELLDAAGRAFADLGVAKATMVDICRYAGCSRATLYRYFENREALHLAYVNRAALAIASELNDELSQPGTHPSEALTDRILAGIEGVRSDPLLAIWFEPENLAVPIALSQDSQVLGDLAAGFMPGPDEASQSSELAYQRGAWLLRCIVALLAMPATDPTAERSMVESFLVPVLMGTTGLETQS